MHLPLWKFSPDGVYFVFSYVFVDRYDRKIFQNALSYQQAVKHIAVVKWKIEYLQRVADVNRQCRKIVFVNTV